MKTTRLKISVLAIAVAGAFLLPVPTDAASKVTLDNQSGKAALVKLVGPTAASVSVENGKKESLSVASGHYFIKIRYGAPGAYSYSKGDEFDVTETVTKTSDITITLPKVVAGNYGSKAISEAEFGPDEGTDKKSASESHEQIRQTTFKVQYPGLDSVETQDFKWSFAFLDSNLFVYLVFRNYDSPAHRFEAEPTEGHAELLIILQRFFTAFGGTREKVTAGDYRPGLYPKALVNPKGSLLLTKKDGEEVGVNACYWTAKNKAKTEYGLLAGTVTVTDLGSKPKSFIKGSLNLKSEDGTQTAKGDFCIPIIETPTDFEK